MRPTAALVVLLLLVPAGFGAVEAATGDDCGSGRDASASDPIHLYSPTLCGIHASDDDVFTFDAIAGNTVRVRVHPSADLHVRDPTGTAMPITQFRVLSQFQAPLTGTYKIIVGGAPSALRDVTLHLTTRMDATQGELLLPHPATDHGVGLAKLGGPGSSFDSIDGTWLSLPKVSGGKDWIELEFDGQTIGAIDDLDVHFYDAALQEIPGACEIQSWNEPEQCIPPIGATRVLIDGSAGLQVAFELRYYY